MSMTMTIAQVRKLAAAADDEEIPDSKVVEIGIPSMVEFSWGDDEDVIAVREPRKPGDGGERGEPGQLIFLLDGEGTRL